MCAAQCCLLLTNDSGYLDFPRAQQDHIVALGRMAKLRELQSQMSLWHHWIGVVSAAGGPGDNAASPVDGAAIPADEETFVVPYRYGDAGWFDWQPLAPMYPAALLSMCVSQAWPRGASAISSSMQTSPGLR